MKLGNLVGCAVGLSNALAVVGMGIFALWLFAGIDPKSAAFSVAYAAGWLVGWVRSLPWSLLTVVGLFALLLLMIALAWGRIRHLIATHRPVNVKIVE